MSIENKLKNQGGYTLIELVVAVGLFALVMLLVSGAYLMMINVNQQTQNISTGIDNFSFALDAMTHDIRVGSGYTCPTGTSDCTVDASSGSFALKNESGIPVSYTLSGSAITKTTAGVSSYLTDATTVTVTSLVFYVTGTKTAAQGDLQQARVMIAVTGTVSSGAGKALQSFTVETGATMRGSDI
jgi:prepilin-type N-terminal cleavage/methylation domain-containing protein